MSWPDRLSIRAKLFALVVLTTGMTLLVAGITIIAYDAVTFKQQKLNDAATQAEMIGAISSAALIFNDVKAADEYLATLKAIPEVTAAVIYDVQGRMFATYVRSEGTRPVTRPDAPPVMNSGEITQDDDLLLFRPIKNGAEEIGTVYLRVSMGRVSRLLRYAGVVLLLSMASMLVVLALSARLQAIITKPLIEVTEVARYVIGHQDYSRRVVKRSDDEVGVLVDAFNQMLGQIEQRKAAFEAANSALQQESAEHQAARSEVAELNRDLEKRVAERTAELETANRAKSTFLATMSHEIRTPMNGVLGMLELLGMTSLDAEQRKTVGIVRESGRSLLRIIDDILDFSKMEAGKLEVRPEVASVKQIVHRVFSIYSGNASSKGLLLKFSTDPRISAAVWVDPVRLQQILNNFVSNAVKFTNKGEIDIRAKLVERTEGEDVVRFSVKDTGIGISLENQKRLFQPFMQADADTSRQFGGTGLGLSICRRLAEMMGGTIEISSELGHGTTMWFTLLMPIASPADIPKTDSEGLPELLNISIGNRSAPPDIEEAAATGKLVLLVDDHPINSIVLVRQVNTLGYAAETAENGLVALNKWRSGRYAFVITDCNMPEMDGYSLARNIRAEEAANGLKHTPIVACTANALGGEAETCLAAGMDDYLVKPVNLAELMKKLDHWLPLPANSRAPDAAPPLDRAVLDTVSGGVAAIEQDLITVFRHVNEEDTATLRNAVAARDVLQVTYASHRIKGASRMIGAMELATVSERIEAASQAVDWIEIDANMVTFDGAAKRLASYFNARGSTAR